MRTAHSSEERAPIVAPASAAIPTELTVVLLVAQSGAGAELQARLLDNHPAIHARGDEFLPVGSVAGGVAGTVRAVEEIAAGAVRDASLSLRRGAMSPLRVLCINVHAEVDEGVDAACEALPGARAICLIRDGRDAVVEDRMSALRDCAFDNLSLSARAHAEGAAAFVSGKSNRPVALFCEESLRVHVARWVRSLRPVFRAAELLGEGARMVRVEHLVQETIRTHASTCRWLGVAGDAAHVHSAIDASRTHLSAASRPGAWRGALREADMAAFKRMAGELLIELGYEQGTGW